MGTRDRLPRPLEAEEDPHLSARGERQSDVALGDSALSNLLRAANDAHAAAAAEQEAEIARLRDEVQRHQMAIDAMSQGVCVFDADMRVVFFNQRLIELYRFDPNRMKPGVPWRDVIEMRDAAGTSPLKANSHLATHQPMRAGQQSHEWLDRLPDGRTLQVRRQALPGGGWISLHQDVTQLKDPGTPLDERLSLQTLIDCLHDNVWVKDAESRFVVSNKVTAKRMGFASPADLIGKTDLELLPAEIAQKFYDDEQTNHPQRPADDRHRGIRP